MEKNTKKLTALALLTAVSLVLSYVEAILPFSLGIPGAKIGLPNIVTVVLLYTYGTAPAFFCALARIVLSSLLFGNLFAVLYSLSGFFLSFAVMVLLKKSGMFSTGGVSTAGGVAHNLGQLLLAALLAGRYVLSYFPVLCFAGTAAGAVIGAAGGLAERAVSGELRRRGLL